MTKSRKKVRMRRTFNGLGLRLAAIVPLCAIGAVSISDTLANVVVKSDPEAAKALAPWDGVVVASAAKIKMTAQPESGEQSEPAMLATRALQSDPTAVEALNVLGSQAQLRGETERAQRLFTQSLALSRRELRAHLWAIEEAVSRGDIAGALKHYDFALRTSKRAPDLLLPTLSSAIEEPLVRSDLLRILNTNPVWLEQFLDYISQGEINPLASVELLTDEKARQLPVEDNHRTALVDAIAKSQRLEDAWQYYSSFRSASRRQSRDARFSAELERPSIFDWNIESLSGISAGVLKAGDRRILEFSASPSVGGAVLAQQQALLPGQYTFRAVMTIARSARSKSPYWTLKCEGGAEVWRMPVARNGENLTEIRSEFTVSADCPSQILLFVIRSTDDISGISGQIMSAEIVPSHNLARIE
ncbi:tetratricopeptide repeat protein [Qipengyuania sp. NPDC077563]|uniref:tetratricopeptide repeat protein n=1 Tax=Qipengyuania sp. NPDC077563 TaxID=3364497 RepID=UPI00384A6DA1